jgi:hypothetical protein
MWGMSWSVVVYLGIVTVFVAGAICVGEENGLALEQALPANSGSEDIELRLAGGKVYGRFVSRPLLEVLGEIGGQSGIEYFASRALLAHQVSGTFHGATVPDALKKVLEPFNYVLVTGETGELTQLFLIGVKSEVVERTAAESSGLPSNEDPISTEILENFYPADREHFFIDISDSNAPLPPEFEEYASAQPPESQRTGPRDATENVQDLPEFEPFTNNTGPMVPDLNPLDFPEFQPYYSEAGPPIP